MRYIRKETVFLVKECNGSGTIFIPECMLQVSNFGKMSGQSVCVSAKGNSIAISTVHASTDNDIAIMTIINKSNLLSVPYEILSGANIVNVSAVVLYLMDLGTILMFPMDQELANSERYNNVEQNNLGEHLYEDSASTSRPIFSDGFFYVENRNEILKIRFSDIFYFEKVKGTHNTCVVFTGGISTFKSDLQDVLERLDGGFLQCHKAFVANMSLVRSIEKRKGLYVLNFDNNQNCPCSLLYRKAVLNWKL